MLESIRVWVCHSICPLGFCWRTEFAWDSLTNLDFQFRCTFRQGCLRKRYGNPWLLEMSQCICSPSLASLTHTWWWFVSLFRLNELLEDVGLITSWINLQISLRIRLLIRLRLLRKSLGVVFHVRMMSLSRGNTKATGFTGVNLATYGARHTVHPMHIGSRQDQ